MNTVGGSGAAEAQALWTVEPGRAEIRDTPLPPPTAGTVTVRSLYGAISRGTESLVFRGEVPPGEYERMRAPFQDGHFPGPVKYGYINVGLVEAGPAELIGTRVFSLYPHQTRYRLPASAVSVLPDNVPAARAVLSANLETAINGVWDATPRAGDRIVVVGAGAVGALVAWLAGGIVGCQVTLVDIDPAAAATAAALGVGFALPETAPSDADIVFHASGTPSGLTTALERAGFEATIVEMSWYGTRAVCVPLGGAFHARRLRLQSSQVGHVATAMRARWTPARRLALALHLLADPVLDTLISGECRFDELPATLERLATTPERTLCHRVVYPAPSS